MDRTSSRTRVQYMRDSFEAINLQRDVRRHAPPRHPTIMPPLPDTLYDETKAKLDRLDRRLRDAQTFQIPRLRNHVGSTALQQQYAAELREDLERCRRELQVRQVSLCSNGDLVRAPKVALLMNFVAIQLVCRFWRHLWMTSYRRNTERRHMTSWTF